MAAKVAGKYTLRGRNNEADFEIFEADIDSDIDTDIDSDIDTELGEEVEDLLDGIDDVFDDEFSNENNDNVNDDVEHHVEQEVREQPKQKKTNVATVPPGWDDNNWVDGDVKLDWLPEFTEEKLFLVDIPDEADELYFFKLFISDELLENVLLEINRYARSYISKELSAERLPPKSRFRLWPGNGITLQKLKIFIALTFYFGVVKKDNVKSYWSTNDLYATPFPRKVMSRDEFFNIFSFLHLCDNATYVIKGQDGYDPRKKLGVFYEYKTKRLAEVWFPRQYLSIDEGCIPFKGRVHFKCYNPSKIDKYHIKTFKLVDSTNNYCLKFDLYVGIEEEKITQFGKTHDLVLKILQEYLGKSYIIFMDNFYTSPYLFYNLKINQTGDVGTLRINRKGVLNRIRDVKLKKKGDEKVMSYKDEMCMIKIHDRKVVTLLSTVYNSERIDTGRKDYKTNDPITKPLMMTKYNKYMGGVDANDQLLKYSHFSKRTIKWWKKVFFRMLNVCMVNSFILWKEYMKKKGVASKNSQTEFRIDVITKLVGDALVNANEVNNSFTGEFDRLTGRHFMKRIPVPPDSKSGKVFRTCKVCSIAEREFDHRRKLPKRKRTGHETRYECSSCNVALCVDICFELFHTQKNYIDKYIDEYLRIL